MKKLLFILLVITLANGCNNTTQELSSADLQYNSAQELLVTKKEKKSFTGVLVDKYQNGNIIKRETYKNGVLDGHSEYYSENGKKTYEGDYKKGKREGVHKKYAENGEVIETFTYKDDKLNGKVERNYIIPRDYDGRIKLFGKLFDQYYSELDYFQCKTLEIWEDGVSIEKKEIIKLKNGNSYEVITSISKDKKDKYMKKVKENSELDDLEPRYINYFDYYDITEIYREADGKIAGTFINGKKDGEFRERFSDGDLKAKGKYINDKKEGKWIFYYSDGKAETNYKNGLINGEYKDYDEDGKLLSTVEYIDGKEKSKIKNIITYDEWVKDGKKGRFIFRDNNIDEKGKVNPKNIDGYLIVQAPSYYESHQIKDNQLKESHKIFYEKFKDKENIISEVLIRFLNTTPEKREIECSIYLNNDYNPKLTAKFLVDFEEYGSNSYILQYKDEIFEIKDKKIYFKGTLIEDPELRREYYLDILTRVQNNMSDISSKYMMLEDYERECRLILDSIL